MTCAGIRRGVNRNKDQDKQSNKEAVAATRAFKRLKASKELVELAKRLEAQETPQETADELTETNAS